ncbi:MAG: DUF4132 domain-containing protein, partial [Nakamurella sp.]
MPDDAADENSIDVPDEWSQAVRPRRGGRNPVRQYRVSNESVESLASAIPALTEKTRTIVRHPGTDQSIKDLLGTGKSIKTHGLTFAILSRIVPTENKLALAASYLQGLGMAAGAAAIVESAGFHLRNVRAHDSDEPELAVFRKTSAEDSDSLFTAGYSVPERTLDYLRRRLIEADEQAHRETIALLEPYRSGLLSQRVMTSYLLPEQREWVAADIADLPADYRGLRRLLLFSAGTPAQLRSFLPRELAEYITIWDGLGDDAVPVLLRSCHEHRWYRTRELQTALDVLSRLPSDAAFDGLLDRIDWGGVPAQVKAAAARYPGRAIRLMTKQRYEPVVSRLLREQLAAHPDLAVALDAVPVTHPIAAHEQIPALLSSPPWTHPKPKRSKRSFPIPEPSIHWRGGEHEEWSDTWRGLHDSDWEAFRKEGATVRFITYGPEEIVRPLLATWPAEDFGYRFEDPQAIVAKYELDALPAVLRLARKKPVIGAALLMPYRSAEVAQLMTKWLAGSRQFRPIAQEWFERHGTTAAVLLLHQALGGTVAESRTALQAAARLDSGVILAAAAEMGCAAEVTELLGTDPLDVIPARVPTVPSWLDLDLLPQVLLAGGADALPRTAIEALCRMTAMSDLDAPYEGLQIVADACDRTSLAEFGWALYAEWTLADRPGKDAWAMDALGYFGDDAIADRLAPLVRRWPSDGAAPRAKRGAEILARIGSTGALQHLGQIARNAKSGPLRAHASVVLDRAAVDRGLLPEQLEDMLAPDLGLGGEPISYQDNDYQVDLGNKLDFVLRSTDGAVLTALPTPRDDEQKAAVSDWSRRRRQAKAAIADQTRRLEEAMIVQRRWTAGEFSAAIAGHPLLGRLARRLIWCVDDQTAIIDSLGDLVDASGGLLPSADWVRLAHPSTSDLRPWRRVLAERKVGQPFAQIDRETFDGDPSAHWSKVISAASLYSLIRRGWQWGPTGRAAPRDRIFRPFGAEGNVVLMFEPGLSAVVNAAEEPVQTIESLTLESPRHGEFAVFGDLHKVTRSELIRDLATLKPA